jgi:tetratricopeptide (TPR) repeat protein
MMSSIKRIALVAWVALLSACASIPPSGGTGTGQPLSDGRLPPQAVLHTGTAAVDKLLLEGEAQRKAGDLVAAADTLERAMRLAPRAPEVYVALARVQLDQGDFVKAENLAQRALSRLGDDVQQQARRQRAEAWSIIANARRALGNEEAAEAAMRNASGMW